MVLSSSAVVGLLRPPSMFSPRSAWAASFPRAADRSVLFIFRSLGFALGALIHSVEVRSFLWLPWAWRAAPVARWG